MGSAGSTDTADRPPTAQIVTASRVVADTAAHPPTAPGFAASPAVYIRV